MDLDSLLSCPQGSTSEKNRLRFTKKKIKKLKKKLWAGELDPDSLLSCPQGSTSEKNRLRSLTCKNSSDFSSGRTAAALNWTTMGPKSLQNQIWIIYKFLSDITWLKFWCKLKKKVNSMKYTNWNRSIASLETLSLSSIYWWLFCNKKCV